MKPFALLATAFLGLVSLGHLLRVLFGIEFRIGRVTIPIWASAVAFLFSGALAVLLAREQRRARGSQGQSTPPRLP